MSLAKVNEILTHATKHQYGVAAVNTFNIESAKYIIKAAEAERVPVIVQFYPGLSRYTALKHLAFAQYTVTTTLLAASAAFLFYTTDISLNHRVFIRKNIPVALMVGTAYLVRSEMLLLVLPMICAAGVAKWGSEEKIFTKNQGEMLQPSDISKKCLYLTLQEA